MAPLTHYHKQWFKTTQKCSLQPGGAVLAELGRMKGGSFSLLQGLRGESDSGLSQLPQRTMPTSDSSSHPLPSLVFLFPSYKNLWLLWAQLGNPGLFSHLRMLNSIHRQSPFCSIHRCWDEEQDIIVGHYFVYKVLLTQLTV